MTVDVRPVLGGLLKRLGGVPFRIDLLHDTFQAVDMRLPAIRPSAAWNPESIQGHHRQSNGRYLSRHPQQAAHHPDYAVLCAGQYQKRLNKIIFSSIKLLASSHGRRRVMSKDKEKAQGTGFAVERQVPGWRCCSQLLVNIRTLSTSDRLAPERDDPESTSNWETPTLA
ncbi:hypothetical protein FMUND_7243 [Fusarium mundagurra]|uniref:Uncharacterized protein n=1 Tax=Fusarium mundagurra TaxID=1567541 RepID=A0A8H6DF84_9HYPO|nr:hypothetical protein FMUND_7243 [Fusarium mundagurra]